MHEVRLLPFSSQVHGHGLVRITAGVVGAMCLSGCAHVGMAAGPKPAFNVTKDIAEFDARFGSATSIAEYYKQSETKERRDAFISGRLTLYNLQYVTYINNFTLNKALAESAFDITKLGVDLSITLVGRPYTKTLLGAISGMLTGSRTSIEKNFLEDKTTAALIGQMNADRKTALIPILAGLQRSTAEYPLSTAIVDLQNYYEAGTPAGALQTVQVEAAQREAVADRKIEQYRTVSFSQDETSTAIRKWLYPAATTKSPGGRMLGPDGNAVAADTSRAQRLRQWMIANGWGDLPIERLLDAENLAPARRSAASELGISID